MLDKSIPYKNIIMKLSEEALLSLTDYALPEGFRFKSYQLGDESAWAEIEYSVGEFSSIDSARGYFDKVFAPHLYDMERRCTFIVAPEGEFVGTATLWYTVINEERFPVLTWIAVKPEHQGKGLGRAIVTYALKRTEKLHGNADVLLHTQTWSHPAITLYSSLGFRMQKTRKLSWVNDGVTVKEYPNEYLDAMEILSKVMRKDAYETLMKNSE
jgi:ribosomal protein S18 acetylase RimI-like enzyme